MLALPLCYQRAFHGDIYGHYMVYSPWNLHLRLTVPAGWCQTSGAGPAAPPAQAMTSLVRTSTWIYQMPNAAQQETDLESSSWLRNTPCQWGPGWDWLLTQQRLCCPEWLRVSQAGSGTAPPRITGILDHDLFGCSCELELTVEPPASTGGRQVGLERKPWSAQGKLGQSKMGRTWNTTWNFSKVEARAPVGWQLETSINRTEDHVSSLFCCYSVCSITIKLNSISQSDQSSWRNFCESLYRKSFR